MDHSDLIVEGVEDQPLVPNHGFHALALERADFAAGQGIDHIVRGRKIDNLPGKDGENLHLHVFTSVDPDVLFELECFLFGVEGHVPHRVIDMEHTARELHHFLADQVVAVGKSLATHGGLLRVGGKRRFHSVSLGR